jgi:hypothetical protein
MQVALAMLCTCGSLALRALIKNGRATFSYPSLSLSPLPSPGCNSRLSCPVMLQLRPACSDWGWPNQPLPSIFFNPQRQAAFAMLVHVAAWLCMLRLRAAKSTSTFSFQRGQAASRTRHVFPCCSWPPQAWIKKGQANFGLACYLALSTLFKLTWLVLGGDPADRSHRVEQFTAL